MSKRTGLFHALSGAAGGILCGLSLHRWCPHRFTESDVIGNEIVFRCKVCGVAMEALSIFRDGEGIFTPVRDARCCLRCGVVKL